MGKKRIKVMGAGEAPKKEKRKAAKTEASVSPSKKVIRKGKGEGRITDMGQVALEEADRIAEKEKKLEKEARALATETAKETQKKKRKTKKHSRRYLAARAKIDRHKFYPLEEAVKLVKETSLSRFNGSVELHLVVKETGLSGEISFPHPTGKQQKVAIADDKLINKIKKGKIDFDLLLASPAMMPKLAPLAKTLGPKGLMPNPKKGTISEKPEALARKLAGKTRFQTEKKSPLIHLVVGKVDQPEKNLLANIQVALKAIGSTNISKVILCPTMGPGVKVNLESV